MPDYRSAKIWKVELDLDSPFDSLVCRGNGLVLEDDRSSKRIGLELEFAEHDLAAVTRAGAVTIAAPPGNVVPCFTRVDGRRLKLSNSAALLFDRGESIGVKSYVAIQQLLGQNYPQDNLFAGLKLLEASSIYALKRGALSFEDTAVRPQSAAKPQDAIDIIHGQFEAYARTRRPLCVLLSGGIDSRLNLALALKYAGQHGNRVVAFHEFKDADEVEISRQVAERARVPLTVKTRKDFANEASPVILDPDFIRFQSGTYRDNLVRWHGYLDWIKESIPEGIILGLGYEAHKGKWYGQIHRLPKDAEIVLGVPAGLISHVAERLGIGHKVDRGDQRKFFEELTRQCAGFEDHIAKVDYLHYVTYVGYGYGRRGHDVMQYYGIPFPFINNRFLQTVFSLRREDKEGFKLVQSALNQVAPDLAAIPLTSANAKALAVKTYGLRYDLSTFFLDRLRPLRDRWAAVGGKGRQTLHADERLLIESDPPESEVTRTLHDVLCGRMGIVPRIRLDYVVQLYVYLQALEKELGLSFDWV